MGPQIGEVAVKPFSNAAMNQICSFLGLLTFCVLKFKDKGGRTEQIENVLNNFLKRIRSKDENFFHTWGTGYGLKDALHRLFEIGILDEKMGKSSEDYLWRVSKDGIELLQKKENLCCGKLKMSCSVQSKNVWFLIPQCNPYF